MTASANSGGLGQTGGNFVMWGHPLAEFEDGLTIDPPDPSLLFQPGTFVAVLELEGQGHASAGGALSSNTRAEYNFSASIGDYHVSLFGEWFDFGNESGFTGDLPEKIVSDPIQFTFGIEIPVRIGLSLLAQAVPALEPVPSQADLDFGGSMRWGGIQEVRDGDGHLVAGYSTVSLSGTDYFLPVPEPDARVATLVTFASLAVLLSPRAR
jgi:hypothetical protein